MDSKKRIKRVLVTAAVVIYVAMFAITSICAYKMLNHEDFTCVKNCSCDCCVQKSKQSSRKMKSINKCLEILVPAKNAKAKCEWLALKKNSQVGIMENYFVEESKEIPAETLARILDSQYYMDVAENVNSGIYMPIAKVSYISEKGKTITLVYSFANAQVNLYRDEEMLKEAMLYNPNELINILESL